MANMKRCCSFLLLAILYLNQANGFFMSSREETAENCDYEAEIVVKNMKSCHNPFFNVTEDSSGERHIAVTKEISEHWAVEHLYVHHYYLDKDGEKKPIPAPEGLCEYYASRTKEETRYDLRYIIVFAFLFPQQLYCELKEDTRAVSPKKVNEFNIPGTDVPCTPWVYILELYDPMATNSKPYVTLTLQVNMKPELKCKPCCGGTGKDAVHIAGGVNLSPENEGSLSHDESSSIELIKDIHDTTSRIHNAIQDTTSKVNNAIEKTTSKIIKAISDATDKTAKETSDTIKSVKDYITEKTTDAVNLAKKYV